MTRITPTVGRVVLVHLSGNANALAGLVGAVHARGINVAVFDEHAVPHRACGIPLIQDGDAPPVSGSWAEWMLYQKGQAGLADKYEGIIASLCARVAEVEKRVADRGVVMTLTDAELAAGVEADVAAAVNAGFPTPAT